MAGFGSGVGIDKHKMLTNGIYKVAKVQRARGAAFAAPVAIGSSSGSSGLLQQPQRLRPSLVRAAAAAAPAGPQAGNGLLERVKAVVKGIGTGLPLVAFSTISGGVLAGSLHTVTGAWLAVAFDPSRVSTACVVILHRTDTPKSNRRDFIDGQGRTTWQRCCPAASESAGTRPCASAPSGASVGCVFATLSISRS